MNTPLKRTSLALVSVLILSLALALPAWSSNHGGGGGGGAGTGGGDTGSSGSSGNYGSVTAGVGGGGGPIERKWTATQLKQIFKGVDPSDQSDMVKSFTGTTVSMKQLVQVRQIMLAEKSKGADRWAGVMDAGGRVLEILDKGGQLAQNGLSYVPGVGLVTSTGLSTMRAGADAYKQGKSAKDIAKAALVSGLTNAIMDKLSVAGGTLNKLRKASSIAFKATSSKLKKTAAKLAAKLGLKFLAAQQVDNLTEKAVSGALQAAANTNGLRNRTPSPYGSPYGGFGGGMGMQK